MTERVRRRVALAFYAVLAYVPLLLSAPGQVSADTKAYLYTDPGRLLERAGTLWDPNVAAGTVTHQTIGYLFPMGPYYWLFDQLGAPDWLAQRLWLGTILFAAGSGARWLVQRLGLGALGGFVAGLVYLASPYIIPYFGRTSALLLPFAALPWLTGLLIESIRVRGWRAPVLFGIVLTIVGGTNASSVVFIAIGPALWLPFAIWAWREVTVRQCAVGIGRLVVTCIPAQLWWIAGLRVQGAYGLPILSLTETVETVAQTSSASEVARGAGYWYAYGRDSLSPWTPAAVGYTQHLWLIATSFAIPAAAMLAALWLRWRYRAYFVVLAAVGLVVGVGTYPYDAPPPFGWLVKLATEKSAAALALRNSPRAVPLLVLATAALVGCGIDAIARSDLRLGASTTLRQLARPVAAGVVVIGLVNLAPLFQGEVINADLRFPEHLPQYWHDATQALDARDDGTRVLELPGSDFAAYRWGETQDPVTPGLMQRPWLGRELTAYGTPGTVDLLRALDRRIQEGVFDPRSIAPVARLFSAGDVLWRSDTQYERYRGPRPPRVWEDIRRAPGLGEPELFGTDVVNVADRRRPMRDELALGAPSQLVAPPALAVFPVDDVPPIVHARSTGNEIVMAGDGESVVDAAEAGLLAGNPTVLYSASFANDPGALRDAIDRGADLLLTDGNRRNAERWGTIRENKGYTEPAGGGPLERDPKDTRLDLFPGAGDATRTVAQYRGIESIAATTYGNTVAYSAESRPALALDGDLRTAWQLGGFSDVVGERLRVVLDEPVTTDAITVAQTSGNRFITRLGVAIDGRRVDEVDLTGPSFDDAGQTISLGGTRSFTEIELEILDANVTGLPTYLGWSSVGLREIGIAGVQLDEVLRLPTDLLDAAAPVLADHDLTVLLTRWRADPGEPFRADPEPYLARSFALPADRTFTLDVEARIETRADGHVIDAVLGVPGTEAGYAVASGSDVLGGDLAARPSAAIDGDPTTAWSPGFGDQMGRSFHVALPQPRTFDRFTLQVVADGWHSVPTQLTLVADDGQQVVADVAPVPDAAERGSTATVAVALPQPLTAGGFTVQVSGVRPVTTTEYFSGDPIAMPVGIAELGIDGVQRGPLPAEFSTGCRRDLLTIDGRPAPVRVEGSISDALARRPLRAVSCDGGGPALEAGDHVVRTAKGRDVGLSIDRVQLTSPASPLAEPAAAATEPPSLAVHETGRVSYDVEVTDATAPFWFILGQSQSDGWHAELDGRDLGPSTLVDGYANGWLIDPATAGSSFVIQLRWTPQRAVDVAVVVSAVALAALAIAAALLVRRSRRAHDAQRSAVALPDAPRLVKPWVSGRVGPAARRPAIAVVAGSALVGAFVGGATVGVLVGLLAAASLAGRWPRLAAVTTIASLYPLVTAWYLAKQWRNAYPPGVEWPAMFGWTHQGVLVAMFGLLAVITGDRVRPRARVAAPPPALARIDRADHGAARQRS